MKLRAQGTSSSDLLPGACRSKLALLPGFSSAQRKRFGEAGWSKVKAGAVPLSFSEFAFTP